MLPLPNTQENRMFNCPNSVMQIVNRVYPSARIKFVPKLKRFVIYDEISENGIKQLHRITDYKNRDGSLFPVSGDRALEILRKADNRLWPLKDRVALFSKEEEEEEAKMKQDLQEHVRDVFMDDYTRIMGVPTFFMGPSMQESKAKYRPGQEKLLKKSGII